MSRSSAPGGRVAFPPGAEAVGQQLHVAAVVQVAENLLCLLPADLGARGDVQRGAVRQHSEGTSAAARPTSGVRAAAGMPAPLL